MRTQREGEVVSAALSVREWTQNEGEERRQNWTLNIERREATCSKTKGSWEAQAEGL